MNFSSVAPLLADAGLSLSQKGITAAKVVLTGFVVVFAVLFLLIFIINIYGTVITKIQQKGKKKKDKAGVAATSKQQTAAVKSAPVASVAGSSTDSEIIAVISAAVALMYGSPEKVRIKSVKKTGSSRNAWSNAGLFDNTRPF